MLIETRIEGILIFVSFTVSEKSSIMEITKCTNIQIDWFHLSDYQQNQKRWIVSLLPRVMNTIEIKTMRKLFSRIQESFQSNCLYPSNYVFKSMVLMISERERT